MIVALRILGLIACGALVWMVGLSAVPSQLKLPVERVVVGARLTQPFGCTSLALEPKAWWCPGGFFHSGMDLAAPVGTEVYSATSGVASAGYDGKGAGNYVVVQFDRRTRILYCHLSTIRVRPGMQVEPGQLLGTVGASGLATGPHLHFEIDVAGVPVDPAAWLASPGASTS